LAAPAPIPGTPIGGHPNTPKRAFSLDSPSSVLPVGSLRTPDNDRVTPNGTSHINYFNRNKKLSIGKPNKACCIIM
jgi:hypothetical protein